MKTSATKGFTLLEMLIALSIFSLLFTISGIILSHSFANWEDNTFFMGGLQSSHLLLMELSYKLRGGKNITVVKGEMEDSIYFQGVDRNGKEKWFYYGVYKSGEDLALGLKTAENVESEEDFGYYSPLVNGIERFEIEDVRGDKSLLKIELKLRGHKALTSLMAIKENGSGRKNENVEKK